MIQRPQTVYLILALLTLWTPLFGGLFTLVSPTADLYLVELFQMTDLQTGAVEATGLFVWMNGIMLASASLLIVYSISQFKARKIQMKTIRMTHLLVLALIVYWFFRSSSLIQGLVSADVEVTTEYSVWFYGPVVSLAFLILAQRGVKKDEELVNSLDRLRS